MVAEEKILGGYSLDPLFIVGMEGFWGCLVMALMLPAFQRIECTGELCHGGRLEDSMMAFKEL
jgi:hypothetical protein